MYKHYKIFKSYTSRTLEFQFSCPISKSHSDNFNLSKVTQTRYQICATNLFFFNKTKIINKSRDLPLTSLWNLPSILRSNSHKIKKCCNSVKNGYIRMKFFQEVYFKNGKSSEMKFEIFWKISLFFPIFNIK